jgi:hypothetical protein
VQAVEDASFWIVFVALGWWQPWYAVWFISLAALDERAWGRGLSWMAALAGLVALWDRFYLTQHWRLPDALSHELHTVLLVFLPPIAWAWVAPRVQTGARLFGAHIGDHLREADRSWRDSVIRSAVSAGGSSSVTTGRSASG